MENFVVVFSTDGTCQEDWVDLANNSYCYITIQDKLPYHYAYSICEQLDAQMITYNDTETHYQFGGNFSIVTLQFYGQATQLLPVEAQMLTMTLRLITNLMF